jgi:non-specific protein-tyrosine kinase
VGDPGDPGDRVSGADAPGLRDVLTVIRARLAVVVVAVVATVAGAAVMLTGQDPVYQASARIFVTSTGNVLDGGGRAWGMVANQIGILESAAVQERAGRLAGVDPAALPPVHGHQVGATNAVVVTVRSGDPVSAAALADIYVEAFRQHRAASNAAQMGAVNAELDRKVAELRGRVAAIDAHIDALDAQLDGAGAAASGAPSDGGSALASELEAERQSILGQVTLIEQRQREMRVDQALAGPGLEVTAPAGAAGYRVEPRPLRTLTSAVLLGLLLGLAAAFALNYLDDRVRRPDDVLHATGGLPVLTLVPRSPRGRTPLAVLRSPRGRAAEAFRRLRTNVEFLSMRCPVKAVLVTSSRPGEGKSTTAVNLAAILARSGRPVVLVEADLRAPTMQAVMRLPDGPGLAGVLRGAALDDALFHQADDTAAQIAVLPAGPPPADPAELLASRAMRDLLADLRGRFAYIVVDAPPILAVSDPGLLSRYVDATVIVARSGLTRVGELEEASRRLERLGARVLGAVFNGVPAKEAGHPVVAYQPSPRLRFRRHATRRIRRYGATVNAGRSPKPAGARLD